MASSHPTSVTTEREAIEDLVIALLAVNHWSVERVFGLRDRLSGAGLFDLDSLANMDVKTVAEKLESAGHRRGPYMNMLLANRLLHVAAHMTPERRQELVRHVERKDTRALESLLLPLRGVGPVVLCQFLLLRDLAR